MKGGNVWNRYLRYGVALLAIIGLAAMWWFNPWAPKTPTQLIKVEIKGLGVQDGASVNAWACWPYWAEFPQWSKLSNPPATAKVSTTLGKVYSSAKCEQATEVSAVSIDLSSRRASFYLWSDATGNAAITVTAQGSGAILQAFNGTKSILIDWPQTVPMCKWEKGWTTCKGKCMDPSLHAGILYTRIPSTSGWGGQGCCPNPAGKYYQGYGDGTCVKQ